MNEITLWQRAAAQLQQQLVPSLWELCIGSARAQERADGLTLVLPNQQALDWVQARLQPVIERTLHSLAGRPLPVTCVLGKGDSDPLAGEALVRAGNLRHSGYVRVWNDLRNFYGPLIGLAGVGLWTELRAHVNELSYHPLCGYAWPGLRDLIAHYADGRRTITGTLERLQEAGLIAWQTGAELIALYEQCQADGLPEAMNPGVSCQRLKRVLQNPHASRVYTVHDPLDLPAFCVRFQLSVTLDKHGQPQFVGFSGRILGDWSKWLVALMTSRDEQRLDPEEFRRLDLA